MKRERTTRPITITVNKKVDDAFTLQCKEQRRPKSTMINAMIQYCTQSKIATDKILSAVFN
jgi:hypothetical protein|tara:strand:+ start:189 stop:371 length:183 start_codon:yes stop_codon:yes gene_type:complete